MVYCLYLSHLLHLHPLGLLVGQDNPWRALYQRQRYRILRHLSSRYPNQHRDPHPTDPISLEAANAAVEEARNHLHFPPRELVSPQIP